MSTTPGRPRTSGIPTPGRLRSFSSSASSQPSPLPSDPEALDKAFTEALKANDPSRHGSRSVSQSNSSHRPSSVASSSRPKTPSATLSRSTHRRPESRQSDVFSRTQRDFTVGDNVRIESLGFEGMLRYVGEIDGKPGTWAGVELSGGFVGKGKNNGSVGDKIYFSCPPKCGVFVAKDKLSAPTVGPGSYSRPSSVASTRASLSGRITPSFTGRSTTPSLYNGRATPSLSNGRVTPARTSGRVTPSSSFGFSTPAARGALKSSSTCPPPPSLMNTPSASAMSKITAGSRASKYVGMTAQQLSARGPKSPSSPAYASPSRKSVGLGSPTRYLGPPSPSRSEAASPSGAPATTPKAGARLAGLGTPKSFGSGRASLVTPKARVPSAVAMPPPPSPPSAESSRSISLNDKPLTPTYSSTSNDTAVDDEVIDSLYLQQNGRALQDKIQHLFSVKRSSPYRPYSPSETLKDGFDDAPKPEILRSVDHERLEQLEEENAQLRLELDERRRAVIEVGDIEVMRTDRDQALGRVQDLESQLKMSERSSKERFSKIESLERTIQASSDAMQSLRADGDARAKDLQAKVDDGIALISSLKEAIEIKSTEAGQNEGVIQAKDAEIGLLEARVKKAYAEIDDVRRDLAGQVDELRQAGQETIALYEERVGVAESKRYELEDLVEELEEKLKRRGSSLAPGSPDDQESEAAKIDNEMLRDQVMHLQKKMSGLEDLLEEARNAAEKEDSSIRSRLQKYKDSEVSMKSELLEVRKDIERLSKTEAVAKGKTEEAEEALRENTLALENARAEIEGLRAEIAALEGEQARNSSEKARAEESSRRAATERSRHNDEVAQLKELLEAARAARKEALQDLSDAKTDSGDASRSLTNLKQMVETLDSDKAELEHERSELMMKLERERSVTEELRKALDQKSTELELVRKNSNRDRPINVGLQDVTPVSSPSSTPSKHDLHSAREEIKGLKHIIQELQKENAAIAGKSKVLESENKMLLRETESLREELKLLEENVEQSLLREERSLALEDHSSEDGSAHGSQKALSDLKGNHDADIDQLRKKLSDVEKKSARTIHDLNKEVNELESLIEAKDELEREIERLKQKVSKGRKSSKSSIEVPETRPAKSSSSSLNSLTETVAGAGSRVSTSSISHDPILPDGEVCEICEQPGHDIFTCPLLKDGASDTVGAPASGAKTRGNSAVSDLFCEDCESTGHLAADCPHSLDVF